MSTFNEVTNKALSLSEEEQLLVADKLATNVGLSDAVHEEISDKIALKRAKEIEDRTAQTMTHEEVFSSVREALK